MRLQIKSSESQAKATCNVCLLSNFSVLHSSQKTLTCTGSGGRYSGDNGSKGMAGADLSSEYVMG